MPAETVDVGPSPQDSGRRPFFKRLFQIFVGLWGLSFTATVAAYLKPPKRLLLLAERTVDVGPVNAFAPGEGLLVKGSHKPFWVILAPNGEFVALPAICTHRHCILQWNAQQSRLICPCHNGVFDLNGNVLQGPPPRPIEPLTATVKGGRVYVYL